MNGEANREYLLLIHKLDRLSADTDGWHNYLKSIYREINRVLKIRNFHVGLYDAERQAVDFHIFVKNGIFKSLGTLKFSRGLAEYVIKTKQPLRINKGLRKFCNKKGIRLGRPDHATKSWLGMPIVYQNNALGVVSIQDNIREGAFKEFDEIVLSNVASKMALVIANARLHEEVRALALTDELTAIPNRRYFDLILEREMKKAVKSSRPVSIAMVMLDDLKKFKSRYETAVIDRLLVFLGRFIKNNVRDTDLAARFTDREFSLILPETNNAGAMTVSDRLRCALGKQRLKIRGFNNKSITVSIGIATYPYNAEALVELIQNAEKALTQAQRLGKNRTEIL